MDLQKNIKLSGENNSQYAYRVLRENIMHLNISPGESINESEISDILEISRTPIREAIFRLREELLIDVYSQSKSCVSLIDFLLALEGQFIRVSLEPQICKILCGKISDKSAQSLGENLQLQKYVVEGGQTSHRFFELDNEFHRLLYFAANKQMSWNILQKACAHLDRIRILNDKFGESYFKPYYLEHKELLRLLVMGNSEDIESLSISHINSYAKFEENTFYPFFSEIFDKYGDYFKNIPKNILENFKHIK
ncbi:MAG: GntR family transcriptional regulator [Ruminiclostridium sp.]